MELVIITGMSGAGKSKAVGALEDAGFFCVDNIPPKMILMMADQFSEGNSGTQRVAVVVDARSREKFGDFEQTLNTLEERSMPYKMIFLDAATEVLLYRYKETRRRHPLMEEGGSLQQAIEAERTLLAPLREVADIRIDTSSLLTAQLRERMLAAVSELSQRQMAITCMSFGFRAGLPAEADLVFDVRCLPNPHYIPELREHGGDEPCVRDYVMQFPQTQQLWAKLCDLLGFLVPHYIQEGKTQLVIAVGCTGGKHRSVATAEHLGEYLRGLGYAVAAIHRDKAKS